MTPLSPAHTTKHRYTVGPSDYGNEQIAAREAYTSTERVKRDKGEGGSKTCARCAHVMRPPIGRSGSSAHASCAHLWLPELFPGARWTEQAI